MGFLFNDPYSKENRRKLRKNQTQAEQKIWSRLKGKNLGFKFFRQYSVGKYILDFYCPKKRLAVELDGGHHLEESHQEYDKMRSFYLQSKNIRVLRFWNNDVLKNPTLILERIVEE